VLSLWCARVVWALLPVSAGGAISDALAPWSTTPARVAAVLLWAAWAVGLVALFAPRPWGLTALRVVAPATVVVAIVAIPGTSAGPAVLAVVTSVVATALALSAPIAQAAGNSIAYGDEVRFPLRVPTSLLLGPVPLAVILVDLGVSAGPLLLADGRYVAGVPVTIVGLALAFALLRSLHALSKRWLVIVPAGVVVVDPLTLVDPVLMRREQIAGLVRAAPRRSGAGALDLRLGSLGGSVELTLHEAHPFARRLGRRDSELREEGVVLVSTVRSGALVALAGERRIPTG
jgi:hypothetical protein